MLYWIKIIPSCYYFLQLLLIRPSAFSSLHLNSEVVKWSVGHLGSGPLHGLPVFAKHNVDTEKINADVSVTQVKFEFAVPVFDRPETVRVLSSLSLRLSDYSKRYVLKIKDGLNILSGTKEYVVT
jgi:hypothetical protein